MKIFGLGTDIVNIKRIENLLAKHGSIFKNKIFSKNEMAYCEKKKNFAPFYAKRYAAKEACAKALGTGLAKGVFWKDISVENNELGKPSIILTNNALKRLNILSINKCSIMISLSDEKDYAIANVIIFETNED